MFTKYTTIIQTSVIISPILSAWIITRYGHSLSFVFFMLSCLITCIPWLILPDLRKMEIKKERTSIDIWIGYRVILNSASLTGLTINRILNNLLFSGIIVLIPVMVAKGSTNNDEFTVMQNIILSFISAGFVVNGFISNRILKKYPFIAVVFAKLSTLVAMFAIIIAAIFNFHAHALYLMAVLTGAGQFYFRISGMTLGQAVTPKDNLAEVILSSDTVVRGFTAIYSMILLLLVNMFDSLIPFFIFSLPGCMAPFFLSKSARTYTYSLSQEE